MRARWLALGLILGMASIAYSQGGPGFFMSNSCANIANPVSGSTVCWQTTGSWFYWDGAAFSSPTLGGPYAPLTLTTGGVLIGAGTGPITATTTPTVSGLTTTGQAALTLSPFGTSTGNTGELRYLELAANGSNYVYLKSPDAITTTYGIVLPSIPGTSGQCLGTDGSNPVVSSWVACSPGAGSGITTLNALTAVTQTFANDTNLQMVSATSTHTLTWAGTLAVSRGGLGVATLALNGVVLGNGTSPVVVSAAGAANTVFRVPGAGGTPAFGALDVSQAAAITGLVRTANLGSGTANLTTFLRGDQTWTAAGGVPTYIWIFNADMEVWGAGTSAVPTGWTVTGSGSVAKNTIAGQFKTGLASMSVTRTSGTMTVAQDLQIAYPPIESWQSAVISCGGWVRATVASTTSLGVFDGLTSSSSSTHTGGGALEFLTVTKSVSNTATRVQFGLSVFGTSTTSQFDSVICVLGSSVANWQPSGYLGRKAIIQHSSGSLQAVAGSTTYFGGTMSATETEAEVPIPFRCVARNLHARVSVAPGGAETATLRLRLNEGLGLITNIVITGAAQQASALTSEQILAQGDRVATRMILSAGAASTGVVSSFECEEVPAGI